jgi:hypothetical protein
MNSWLAAYSARKVKQERAGFNTFSKSGVGHLFWKSRPERGPVRRASRAVVCVLHAVVVIAMVAKEFVGLMSHATWA